METPVKIKHIRRIKLTEPEKVYCITIDNPHKIVIRPRYSKNLYSIFQCNFGMIFGMSFKKFSAASLETSWTLEKVEEFIEQKSLQDSLENIRSRYPQYEEKLLKYYTVSDYLRTQFFKTYKGLKKRIQRNEEFAKENGYIRSFHGAIRRLPLLMYCMENEEKLRRDEDKKEIANLINISANTSIQSDESITVAQAINKWHSLNYPHAWIVGTIHDSIDFYVEKEYIEETIELLKKIFEIKGEGWQRGLVFPIDIVVSDFTKGDYYKKGTSAKRLLEKAHGAHYERKDK